MASVADQLDAEMPGSELSITDREYARLKTKTGASNLSLMDMYRLAGEVPRWPLGEYLSVGPPVPAFTYITNVNSPSNVATYTFPAVPLGAALADRIIVVAYAGGRSTFDTVDFTGGTIQGIAATLVVSASDAQGNFAGVMYAVVPTGTTGDVVINFDVFGQQCSIAVYSITNSGGIVVIDPASDSDNVNDTFLGASLPNTVAGDYVIAIAKGVSGTLDITWTGVNENFDVMNEVRISAASIVATGATLVLATLDTATPFKSMVAVAFRP